MAASKPIGSLYAALGLDSSQFDAGWKRAQQTNAAGAKALAASSGVATKGVARLGAQMNMTGSAAASLAGAIAGIGLVTAAAKTTQLADSYTKFTNQLRVAGLEGQRLAETQEDLFGIAQKYGAELGSIGTLYGRLSGSTKELGLSNKQLLTFVEGAAAALKVSGQSASEASGALLQLSQALGGSKIQAEEYNSLIDGARPLLQAVANGSDRFGGSVAKLTAQVKAGKVSVQEFVAAGLKGIPQLVAQSEKANLTIGASLTVLNNALGRYVGRTDEALSATQHISGAITAFAGNLDKVAAVVGAVALLVGARWAASAAAFVAAEVAKQLALARTTAALASEARVAQLATAANLQLAASAYQGAVGVAALGPAVASVSVAGGVARNALGGLVALLGGPVGVAFAAATVAAYALYRAIGSLDEPSKDVAKTTNALSSATAAYEAAALDAASASGKERDEALKNAAAKKAQAQETIKAAQAKLADARATLAQIAAEQNRLVNPSRNPFMVDAEGAEMALGATGVREKKVRTNISALEAQVAAAEKGIASADRVLKAGAGAGGGSGDAAGKKKGSRDRNAEALADLELRELNARMALTEDVERVAKMKARQVDIETEMANRAIQRDVAEGTITGAAAKIAVAKNNELADLEKRKIEREAQAQLVQQEFAQREAISGDLDRIAELDADYAATAAQRNRIEANALAGQQKLEREKLEEELKQQVEAEAITQSMADARKAAQADRQAAERAAQARKAQARVIEEETELAVSSLRKQQDQLGALAMVTRSTYARAVIEAKILKLRQAEERRLAQADLAKAVPGSADAKAAQDRLDALEAVQAAETEVAKQETDLAHAINDAAEGVRDFKSALKRHDWLGVFNSFIGTLESIQASFQQFGLSGGLMSTGSAVASLIGGKTGNAIGTGLGIAGLGASLGTWLGSSAGAAFAGTVGTALGAGALGAGVANGLMALGSVAAPLALAAGALYAAAKIFNIGGKPSNKGAGFDLRTGAISGDKRSPETEQAARSAGEAIQGITDALKAAGIGLTDAVTGLVIGTRDQTQIYLQSGKTLMSAVGDSGAAVDTAMRALLEGATYVSETQKKLVESALAAGKGFDAIAQILAGYEAAQKVAGQISDQILQLTDPKAFARKQVTDAIKAQRDSLKAAADQGYYTADQLAALNAQLDQLEALQLADVMKQFGDATGDATQKLQDWLASLTGMTASTRAQSAAQAYAALQAAGLAARAGDKEALANIPALGDAYIAAAKAVAGSAMDFQMAVARARAIGSSALLAATNPAGLVPANAMSAANSPTVDAAASQLVSGAGSGADAAGSSDSVSGQLASLKSEVASLREDVRTAATTLASSSSASAKLLNRWDGEGLPPARSA